MISSLKTRLYQLLRWSERYTKTDMVYLTRGGFWLSFAQITASIAAFGTAIAFANLVPPEIYGSYKYILSLAGIFTIFSLPGMQTALSRSVAKGFENVIHEVTLERVKYSLIGTVIALGVSVYYFVNANAELGAAFIVIAATLPLFESFTGYLAYFAGVRRFDRQARYQIFAQTVSAIFLVVTLFFTENLVQILLAYFLPLGTIRLLIYRTTAGTIPKDADSNEVRGTLVYGKHLSLMQLFSIISMNIDKILLWKFFGAAQLAIYTFAIAIPEQLKGPLKGVSAVAFPKFASQEFHDVRKNSGQFWYKLSLYALLLFSISLLYVAAAPFIFKIFFPQYLESITYSQWFALSIVTGIGIVPSTLLEAQRKLKAQYLLNILQPSLKIVLFILLIPPFGIGGAVLAFILGRFLSLAIVLGVTAYAFK